MIHWFEDSFLSAALIDGPSEPVIVLAYVVRATYGDYFLVLTEKGAYIQVPVSRMAPPTESVESAFKYLRKKQGM